MQTIDLNLLIKELVELFNKRMNSLQWFFTLKSFIH